MVRRSSRWREPRVEIDHAALFADAAKAIVRSSALLDAYRKSSGLILRATRTTFARERLAEAGRQCAQAFVMLGRNDVMTARENAAKRARCAYTGDWWTAIPCLYAPLKLEPGDEYFSRETVALIIEQMREAKPDRVG